MKQGRYRVEQIIGILKEAEAGIKVDELSRKYGISDARRLRALEEENRRLKQIVADQTLDIQALKLVISKNF